MTTDQYKAILDLEYVMVNMGWHPSIAGAMIRRAADRVFDSGLGVQQTRRLQRELDPTIHARVQTGGQCQRIQEIPGQEQAIYKRINDLQQQGWNVMEVPDQTGNNLKTYYACPPGQLPMEAQPTIVSSEPWGAPLYV